MSDAPPLITEAQEIYLRLVEKSSCTNLNGVRVAADLRHEKKRWRSVLITRTFRPVFEKPENPFERCQPLQTTPKIDLLPLWYLPSDYVGLDTILIYAEPDHQDALEALAGSWEPDELSFMRAAELWGSRPAPHAMVIGSDGNAVTQQPREFEIDDRAVLFLRWD